VIFEPIDIHLFVRNANNLNASLGNQVKDDVLALRVTVVTFCDIRAMLSHPRIFCQPVEPFFEILQVDIALAFAPLLFSVAADIL
jgi:hypothetical protein